MCLRWRWRFLWCFLRSALLAAGRHVDLDEVMDILAYEWFAHKRRREDLMHFVFNGEAGGACSGVSGGA